MLLAAWLQFAEEAVCYAGLLAEVPRKALLLPQDEFLGPGWDLLTAVAPRDDHEVALNLMLDSALTTSMLLPTVATSLGVTADVGTKKVTGADSVRKLQVGRLEALKLKDTGLDLGVMLPVLQTFPQFEIGRQLGCRVDGMLGMEFYERFGVETAGDRLRLHNAKDTREYANSRGMVRLNTGALKAHLMGVGVSVEGGSEQAVGIIDTGSSHTIVNWAAAALLLDLKKGDPRLASMESIEAEDVNGQLAAMPILDAKLMLHSWESTTSTTAAFESVEIAIGDFALFARVLDGDSAKPAVLVGQDLLTQRPMLVAASERMLCFG